MNGKRVRVWIQHFQDRPNLALQWFDPETGRRKSRSAGTADLNEVEARRVDLESDLNNNRYAEASRMGWDAFRELFEQEYVAGLRPETRRNYADTLDAFEQICQPGRVGSVSERTLSAFVAGLRRWPVRGGKIGLAPSSIRVRLEFLRSALNWAAKQGLTPKVPRFPEVKVPKKKPQPVPAESFDRLLAKAPDEQTRAFLLCGWLAGLRRNEGYYLEREPSERWPWVDWAGDRIMFPAEFAKGDEDQWVPLDPELRRVLEMLPIHGRRIFRFLTPAGAVATYSTVSVRITRLARQAGVKLSMRSLRRGFGCRYAGRVPAQVLQRLMRHTDIAITMDYYANVDDAAMQAVLGECNERCNAAFGGQQKPASFTGKGET